MTSSKLINNENESNSNSEHDKKMCDHNDNELEMGEILNNLVIRQNQKITNHSSKDIEKQNSDDSTSSENKNAKDYIFRNDKNSN